MSNNFLNIKKINKNLYKELKPTFDKKISKNLELGPTFDKKISKNSFKKLRPTLAKIIGKSLNKKLRLNFIYNYIYLRKKTTILITKTNTKVCKLKTYYKAITDLIYNIRWKQVIKKNL